MSGEVRVPLTDLDRAELRAAQVRVSAVSPRIEAAVEVILGRHLDAAGSRD